MKLYTNRLPLSGPVSRRSLLLVVTGVALLLGGSQAFAQRGYYGASVAVAGPRGVAVAGPNGAVAVGRYGGVAVAAYHPPPPVYVAPRVVVAGPSGVAVAGPNGVVAVQRYYAPCYPAGYICAMPVGYSTVYYGGYNCFYAGGIYYRPEYYAGSTVYVVVK